MTKNVQEKLRAIILDRDGVINVKAHEGQLGKYILSPDEITVYPDFLEFSVWAERHDIDLFVATNQQCLALGILTTKVLDQIHQKIQNEIESIGVRPIRKFYVCGHLENTCDCRKPKPGLLLKIQHDYCLERASVLFIGDSLSDKLAADLASINFIQVRRRHSDPTFADNVVENLSQISKVGI